MTRRILMRVARCAVVCGVAGAGCSSSSGAVAASSATGSTTTATALAGSACAGFEHRYVGGGLSVDLPADVAQVSGGARPILARFTPAKVMTFWSNHRRLRSEGGLVPK